MNKNVFFAWMVLLLSIGCKKGEEDDLPAVPQHPVMKYKDLQNAEVSYLHAKTIDVDNDNTTDLSFEVLLVGDPVLQRDRMQFYANSKIERNLLNNDNDESPVLNHLDIITKTIPGTPGTKFLR